MSGDLNTYIGKPIITKREVPNKVSGMSGTLISTLILKLPTVMLWFLSPIPGKVSSTVLEVAL